MGVGRAAMQCTGRSRGIREDFHHKLAELRIRMGGKVWQVQRYHGILLITLLKKTRLQETVKPYGARYTISQRTEQGKKALYIVV